MRVSLWDHVGAGLILRAETGIVWTNQAGGTACLQPEAEGVFVPFGNDTTLDGRLLSIEHSLTQVFDGAPGGARLAEDGLADVFARALADYAGSEWIPYRGITLDRDRLADSIEAWVHVRYQPDAELTPLVEGLGPGPFAAVLTWTNSD